LEKQEEKLEYRAKNNPDYLWTSGSHLYGMNTKDSDLDLRGFVFPSFDYIIGIKEFKSIEFKEDDHKIYSAKYFLELALKGDPIVTEGFFASSEKTIKLSEAGKEILSLKEDIISNAIFGRIMGYSTGEWRKAMAVQLVSKERSKTKAEVINNVRTHWKLNKEKMDDIIKILDSVDEKKTVSSMAGLGVKRKKDVEEYGFCRKSAAHSIRLLRQLIEIMETGEITFPRPDSAQLLEIRQGKYTKEDLEEIHADTVAKAETARDKSVLPDKPNEKKIWKTYLELVKTVIKKDKEFLT
jgi:uncharacterized protein